LRLVGRGCYLFAVKGRVLFECAAFGHLVGCGSATPSGPASDGGLDASCQTAPEPDASVVDSSWAVPNGALHFDGVSDYATSGTAQFPPPGGAQTIALWVQYFSSTGTQLFVGLHNDTLGGLELGLRDGTVAAWTVFGDHTLVAAPMLPAVGAWHHVAFVFDGTTSTLYVDGVVRDSSTTPINVNTNISSWFGASDGLSEFFMGNMDEIAIWSIARTSSQVLDEMRGPLAPGQPGLAAYFNCNAICGSRVIDDSGNGNDLTLGGGDPSRSPTIVASSIPSGP